MRKTSLAIAILVAASTIGGVAAGASTSAKSLAKDLLTAAYAKKAGFTDVAEKASTSSKTGVTNCADGAQEAFENTSSRSGLVAEILVCKTKAAAAKLLAGVATQGAASGTPPKQLGSSAKERASGGPVYTIYWQKGDVFEFVGLETDIPASSTSSTTTTTVPAPPITAAEQKILGGSALSQLKQLG
jgi:hypothetical protein